MQKKRELVTEPVEVQLEDLAKPIEWAGLFGNDRPVEMEIGCGKGTFLTRQAQARKDVNFFGLEWARFYLRYTADRLRRNGCEDNARVVRADASTFLTDFVAEETLAALHIYFPDPWPKARHHKRRLIQPAFLEQVRRVLVPGGRVQVVTDHADYWEQIREVFAKGPLTLVEYELPGETKEGELVGTNFERKYISEGRTFNAIAGRK
jgi:tRNA (guanine-N7-)-methyltransferase